MDQFDLFK